MPQKEEEKAQLDEMQFEQSREDQLKEEISQFVPDEGLRLTHAEIEELLAQTEPDEDLITDRETEKAKQELSKDMDEILLDLQEDDPFVRKTRYASRKGDAVDEMVEDYLNANDTHLPIERIKKGQYLFGTKKIAAEVRNGKLLVRVGGGFMTLDEFFRKFEKSEQEKLKVQMAREGKKLEDVVDGLLRRFREQRFQ